MKDRYQLHRSSHGGIELLIAGSEPIRTLRALELLLDAPPESDERAYRFFGTAAAIFASHARGGFLKDRTHLLKILDGYDFRRPSSAASSAFDEAVNAAVARLAQLSDPDSPEFIAYLSEVNADAPE